MRVINQIIPNKQSTPVQTSRNKVNSKWRKALNIGAKFLIRPLPPLNRKVAHAARLQRKYSTQADSNNHNHFNLSNLTMRKVFWDNPYQHLLYPKVTAINCNKVLFDETIVYSFSGGQESDKATINDLPILDSRMEGHLIHYTLPENHRLNIGDRVKMQIDWNRRYRLMRLHFAAELVLEIVTQKFKLEKVGARICEDKSRVDFLFNQHISCLFDEILSEYNKIIDANKIIEVGYSDIKKQRRFWKIDNFAQVPCGGTHVCSTGEVGYVSLKRSRGGKSIERIEIKPVNNDVPAWSFFAFKEYQSGVSQQLDRLAPQKTSQFKVPK